MDDNMAVEMWSTLPSELVERVLSYLSVPVLCRFRTVCKQWNAFIRTPAFGALCIQHARQDCGRIIVLCEEKGWSFLDLSARRWYNITHNEQKVFGNYREGTVAMDGGLVCQHLYAHGEHDASVFVSSPIARKSRKLPSCTAIGASIRPVLDMAFDNVALAYKIFLIPNGDKGERVSADKPFMVIYESTTNQWRNSTILHTPLIGFPFRATSSIFFHGFLYVLMSPSTTRIAQHDCLWSYNHVEDVWKNTCVDIPIRSFHYPQLIVSDNRLFLASWMQKLPDQSYVSYETWPWAQDSWSYEISEVHLGDRTCSSVFGIAEADIRQVLDVRPSRISRLRFSSVHLKAFGCCKSIVLLCLSTGMSIVYDLRTSLRELLPCKPLQGTLCSLYGKPMNLLFPANTLWDQLHEYKIAGVIPAKNHADMIIDQGRWWPRMTPLMSTKKNPDAVYACKVSAELYQTYLPNWCGSLSKTTVQFSVPEQCQYEYAVAAIRYISNEWELRVNTSVMHCRVSFQLRTTWVIELLL